MLRRLFMSYDVSVRRLKISRLVTSGNFPLIVVHLKREILNDVIAG